MCDIYKFKSVPFKASTFEYGKFILLAAYASFWFDDKYSVIRFCYMSYSYMRGFWMILMISDKRKKSIQRNGQQSYGRRTFIGNIYKLVKDPNLISALTGHAEGSCAFNRYRDIDMKRDLVKILEGKH